jgi:ribonuclease P protein component
VDRRSRRQARGRWFAVTARPNGLGFHRLGIIAARRAIPLAVQRNRQKRIVREVFRTSLRPPPSLDVVVRVLREAGDAESRRAAREELEALLVGLAK